MPAGRVSAAQTQSATKSPAPSASFRERRMPDRPGRPAQHPPPKARPLGRACKLASLPPPPRQAFSHWTWEASGNRLLICDLQVRPPHREGPGAGDRGGSAGILGGESGEVGWGRRATGEEGPPHSVEGGRPPRGRSPGAAAGPCMRECTGGRVGRRRRRLGRGKGAGGAPVRAEMSAPVSSKEAGGGRERASVGGQGAGADGEGGDAARGWVQAVGDVWTGPQIQILRM